MRAHVVSRASCAAVGRQLGLDELFLREAAGPPSDAAALAASDTVIAEVVEAGIGACFLEVGLERVADAVVEAFAGRVSYALDEHVDHKTVLQEELARQGGSVTYALVETSGPDHDRRFTSVALVEGAELGRGSGGSKKASEQEAAREALEQIARAGSNDRERDVSEDGAHAGLQVVRPERRAQLRPGDRRGGRAQRQRQVQHRRRPAVGDGRAVAGPAASPDRTGRAVRRIRRAPGGRRLRGRAGARQRVRHAADRVQRGVGDAAALPRRRERVLPEPGQGAAAGRDGAPVRHRPRPRDALRDRPGQGRGDPAVQAPRAPAVRGGGGGAGQVPAPPHAGRGQAVPRRGGAGARPRPRARGARPAAAAVDAGHGRRAGGEAGRRDRAGADGAAVVGAAGRTGAGGRPARPAGRRRGRPDRGRAGGGGDRRAPRQGAERAGRAVGRAGAGDPRLLCLRVGGRAVRGRGGADGGIDGAAGARVRAAPDRGRGAAPAGGALAG